MAGFPSEWLAQGRNANIQEFHVQATFWEYELDITLAACFNIGSEQQGSSHFTDYN